MGEVVLRLDDVYFAYPNTRALNGVSFELGKGVYGLLGPNGAGKSTLFKIVAGFLKPERGQVFLFDEELSSGNKSVRRHIGYMPEVDTLIPGIDAVTFVAYLAELSGISRKEAIIRAHEVLFYVGLHEERYRPVNEFSTGMRQKLKLAQVLAHNPLLILLDEPTNGMDPAGRQEMLNLIKDIGSVSPAAIVLATHILQDVETCCQYVLIIDGGKMLASAEIGNIHGGKNTFRLKLKGESEKFLETLSRRGMSIEKDERGFYRLFAGDDFERPEFFRLAAEHKVQVRHFEPLKMSLEEVFLEKIGRKNDQ